MRIGEQFFAKHPVYPIHTSQAPGFILKSEIQGAERFPAIRKLLSSSLGATVRWLFDENFNMTWPSCNSTLEHETSK
jgi:hypothetical protein